MNVCVLLGCVLLQDPKLELPDEASRTRSENLIREIFKEDLKKTGSSDRIALAKKLLQQARETQDDPASYYVLLRECGAVAAQPESLDLAMEAVDEIDKRFKADATTLKATLLSTASKTAKTPSDFAALARYYLLLSEDQAKTGDYASAVRSVESASTMARRAKDLPLVSRADTRAKEYAALKSKFEKIKATKDALLKNPNDTEANQTMGEFLCFVKDDWEAGLRHLVKAADSSLKAVAEKDLSQPVDAVEQASIGDSWWALSEKDAASRTHLRARAGYWYERAVGGLAGLSKVKVEKRLQEIGPVAKKDRWVDITDGKFFGRPEKPGEALRLRADTGVGLEKPPKGDYDGVSVRVRFGTERTGHACVVIEGAKRNFYIVSSNDNLLTARFDNVNKRWIAEREIACGRSDAYVLTILIRDGFYVVSVDGQEKMRIASAAPYMTSLMLQASLGEVTFDQIKVKRVDQ